MLSPVQKELISELELVWIRHGELPDGRELVRRYNGKLESGTLTIDDLYDPIFLKALHDRGIALPRPNKSNLTQEQMSAAITMANYMDDRSWNKKLKDLGISPTQWAGWIKNKEFKQFLEEVSTLDFEGNVQLAHQGLMKAMDAGKTDAIKFYLEATGRYSGQDSEVQNLRAVVSRLLDSIQRNVKDPETIQKIANEFDHIIKGEPVLQQPQSELGGVIKKPTNVIEMPSRPEI